MSPARILIVEDELAIAEAIAVALGRAGWQCDIVADGASALARLVPPSLAGSVPALSAEACFDLIILDVGLPDLSGFEVCRRLRSHHPARDLPVLFLTAHSDEVDRVMGLELGGGDYMTKPFSLRELGTRVRLLLGRRADSMTPATPAQMQVAAPANTVPGQAASAALRRLGDFSWHEDEVWVRFRDQPTDLTLTEYRLLTLLLANPRRVFSRAQLLEAVRGQAHPSGERTIDTHIKSLRAKLRALAPEADGIDTHRGLGYAWRQP